MFIYFSDSKISRRFILVMKMTTDYTETKYITAKYLLNISLVIGTILLKLTQRHAWTTLDKFITKKLILMI